MKVYFPNPGGRLFDKPRTGIRATEDGQDVHLSPTVTFGLLNKVRKRQAGHLERPSFQCSRKYDSTSLEQSSCLPVEEMRLAMVPGNFIYMTSV
mmetsp:Transcript_13017/g.38257  ORF Transcript_13017/g.38257 Transcript_13017/m.38257 type:complete len:94 (-) Transcript_13017:299-580(-)